MSKRTIKIYFADFYRNFDFSNNFIVDALKVNFNVELDKDNPDYLFCSCFKKKHFKYDNPIKIFFSGENLTTDYNLYDYSIDSDHLTFHDRHLRYPLHVTYNCEIEKPILSKNDALNRGFCNFVYSNSRYADSHRLDFFLKLSKYKHVDSGGRYLNNVGGPVDDKIDFLSKYKFTIAFENSSKDGYITEKMLDPMVAGSVPIYWGNPTAATDFNPSAFINAHNFPTLDALVEEVKRIDNDNEAYLAMLNAPLYNNCDFKAEKNKQLVDFLFNIINQPFEQAKRRIKTGYTTGLMRDHYFLMKTESSYFLKRFKKLTFFFFRHFSDAKRWDF